VFFDVTFPGKPRIRLAGHFWYNADTAQAGTKCPAIVEFNPYRRRDGTMIGDAKMYPWFAYNDYLCFRIDLPGSGDSEGVLTDEYSEEELLACVQVINQVAAHPSCDGNVGMMGKSWSALNALMMAARKDRPPALKAVIVCDGSDDRYNDDVHYMGGAMMFDNYSWPSSMWGWIAQPPDPAVVGDAWRFCKGASKARFLVQAGRAIGVARIGPRRRCAIVRRYRRAGVHHVGLAGWLQIRSST
jgi:predicted acyl esterase